MQVSSASASPLALTKSPNLVGKGSFLCQVKGALEKPPIVPKWILLSDSISIYHLPCVLPVPQHSAQLL